MRVEIIKKLIVIYYYNVIDYNNRTGIRMTNVIPFLNIDGTWSEFILNKAILLPNDGFTIGYHRYDKILYNFDKSKNSLIVHVNNNQLLISIADKIDINFSPYFDLYIFVNGTRQRLNIVDINNTYCCSMTSVPGSHIAIVLFSKNMSELFNSYDETKLFDITTFAQFSCDDYIAHKPDDECYIVMWTGFV